MLSVSCRVSFMYRIQCRVKRGLQLKLGLNFSVMLRDMVCIWWWLGVGEHVYKGEGLG